ncbi:MAG: aldo/keto reductase [Candidatus Aureabacteria bacterium]|nr:aldo/keto reductase [Candidatus Auribacterota bacterium]
MKYKKLSNTDINISVIGLGTWSFGNDKWWGHQEDKKSLQVLEKAVSEGINLIDTAPMYGRGHSEEVIGTFLKKENYREKVVLATKLGLSWNGRKIFHDLKKDTMLKELDLSRKRLHTDYFDLYQVHWHDPETPIEKTATVMKEFYEKGIIKAIGVSNYSVQQMKEFMKYSPLHSLQPHYNMFIRDIEKGTVPFCIENNISILSYSPLHAGILTGKFFFDNVPTPKDIVRYHHTIDLEEPRLSINKDALFKIKEIAEKYCYTLSQLVIYWTFNQKGITAALVGARNNDQLYCNAKSASIDIDKDDINKINSILNKREQNIS